MLTADIQNSSLWEDLYYTTVDAEGSSPYVFRPIPPITVPYSLNSRLIVALADSTTKRESWYSAGYLSREVSAGVTVGNNYNTKSDYSRRLLLGQPILILFNTLSENYKLSFSPHKWLSNISLHIWKYNGTIQDSLQEEVDLARIDILRTEKKINLLIQNSV